MQNKLTKLSQKTVQSIIDVLRHGDTAQVKFNERDGIVKVLRIRTTVEQTETLKSE